MLPIATRSPSRSARSLTGSPLTTEPLAELQSRRKNCFPRCSTTACRRETIASGSTRSFDGSRPIVRIVVRESGISRRFEEVGLTISLDTALTPPRKVWRKLVSTLTRTPPFVAGSNFQPRTAATTTSSTAWPADSTTTMSPTSPVSLTTKRTSTDTRWPAFSRGARPDGYEGELPDNRRASVSTCPASFGYTCATSTVSGVGVGTTAARGRRRTSTRPFSPAATSSVLDQVSWPSSESSTRRRPGWSLRSRSGVSPAGLPSTLTAAPAGVETMSARPVAAAARRSDSRSSTEGTSLLELDAPALGLEARLLDAHLVAAECELGELERRAPAGAAVDQHARADGLARHAQPARRGHGRRRWRGRLGRRRGRERGLGGRRDRLRPPQRPRAERECRDDRERPPAENER